MKDLPRFPQRDAQDHKGTFGTVVVIGGAPHMIGAPALTAGAALRTGAGLAKILTRPDIMPHCLTLEPSATGIPVAWDIDPGHVQSALRTLPDQGVVLAVGPGLSTEDHLLPILEAVFTQPRPVVLDAVGLNGLAAHPSLASNRTCPLIVTPHPGEYRRLADAFHLKADPVDPARRPEAAQVLARALSDVVVLKGHQSQISDGSTTHTNTTGNPALATAGSGDVLTGMIASLIAQGMPLMDAAVLGAHLHGAAADRWASRVGPVGLTARDLIAEIPATIAAYIATTSS